MLETTKQALLFIFEGELSYFVILRYKLHDFINIHDDYVNDPIETISYRQEKLRGI